MIKAKSHEQIKCPIAGAWPAKQQQPGHGHHKEQASGQWDKRLEDRVPGTLPGTEPGDSVTHTTHRPVCIWNMRGEEQRTRKVVGLLEGGGLGARNCSLSFL